MTLHASPIPRDVLARAVSALEYRFATSDDVGDLRRVGSLTNTAPEGLDQSDCDQRDVITSPTRYLLNLLAVR